MLTAATLLDDAAMRIAERGRGQGAFGPTQRRAAWSALKEEVAADAGTHLANDIIDWNDHHARSKTHMLTVFRAAAERARSAV